MTDLAEINGLNSCHHLEKIIKVRYLCKLGKLKILLMNEHYVNAE